MIEVTTVSREKMASTVLDLALKAQEMGVEQLEKEMAAAAKLQDLLHKLILRERALQK